MVSHIECPKPSLCDCYISAVQSKLFSLNPSPDFPRRVDYQSTAILDQWHAGATELGRCCFPLINSPASCLCLSHLIMWGCGEPSSLHEPSFHSFKSLRP